MPRTRMIAFLLIFGGAVFGMLGGSHAIYTFLDLRNPQRLVPADPSVAQAMANSPLRLSGGRTDMWRAWVGFNFSHSLGVLMVAALAVWAGSRANALPVGIVPALTSSAVSKWFSPCSIGSALLPSALPFGTGCFAAAWALSLR